ncbi:F-box protein 9 [Candida albicans P76067]|nr:F-box protein 9 [Candida albicans P76067]
MSSVNNADVSIMSNPTTSDSLSSLDQQAISLFEQAIKKESQGLMSDAVDLYRKSFKINEQVDKLYRSIHLPNALHKLQNERGKNYITKVDEHKVAKINVDKLLDSFRHVEAVAPDFLNGELSGFEGESTIKFANMNINHHHHHHHHHDMVAAAVVSPLVHLPNDIWTYILEILIHCSPESWFKMSITCKKFAYLGFGQSTIWREICQLIYPYQKYEENQFYLQNPTLTSSIDDLDLPIPLNQLQILPQYNDSWKFMLHNRPFIKFLGCYISVVNYYSEGGKAEFSNAWSNPVKTITYYRYLRFYRDGTVVKVLSVLPPDQVVPYLSKHNKVLPSSISELGKPIFLHDENKESHKIYLGKWTISSTGEIHIIIENGSVSYLTFHYWFQIKSLGHINKHAKLTWVRYNSVRKPTQTITADGEETIDDRVGEIMEFSIRNEKAFKFSRVKSYTHTN